MTPLFFFSFFVCLCAFFRLYCRLYFFVCSFSFPHVISILQAESLWTTKLVWIRRTRVYDPRSLIVFFKGVDILFPGWICLGNGTDAHAPFNSVCRVCVCVCAPIFWNVVLIRFDIPSSYSPLAATATVHVGSSCFPFILSPFFWVLTLCPVFRCFSFFFVEKTSFRPSFCPYICTYQFDGCCSVYHGVSDVFEHV